MSHITMRCEQRGIDPKHVQFVVDNCRKVHNRGYKNQFRMTDGTITVIYDWEQDKPVTAWYN